MLKRKTLFKNIAILLISSILIQQPAYVYAQGAPHTQGWQENQNTMMQGIKDLLAKLIGLVKQAGVNIGNLLKKIGKLIKHILANLDHYFQKIGEFFANLFKKFLDLIVWMKNLVWGTMAKLFSKVMGIFNKETQMPQ